MRWIMLILIAILGAIAYQLFVERSYQKYYNRGLAYYKQESYDKAGTEFLKAISEAQESDNEGSRKVLVDSFLLAAEILELHQGEFQRAVSIYEQLTQVVPNDPAVRKALLRMGLIYEKKLGEPVEAIRCYTTLIEKWPRHTETQPLFVRVMETYISLHEFEQAAVEGQGFLKGNEGADWAPRIRFLIGDARGYQEKWGLAMAQYRKVLANYPDSYEAKLAQFEIGNCLIKQSRWEESLAAYESALSIYPNPEIVRLRIEEARARRNNEEDTETLPYWAKGRKKSGPPVIEPFPEDRRYIPPKKVEPDSSFESSSQKKNRAQKKKDDAFRPKPSDNEVTPQKNTLP